METCDQIKLFLDLQNLYVSFFLNIFNKKWGKAFIKINNFLYKIILRKHVKKQSEFMKMIEEKNLTTTARGHSFLQKLEASQNFLCL